MLTSITCLLSQITVTAITFFFDVKEVKLYFFNSFYDMNELTFLNLTDAHKGKPIQCSSIALQIGRMAKLIAATIQLIHQYNGQNIYQVCTADKSYFIDRLI